MYSEKLLDRLEQLLAPRGYKTRAESERMYPRRHLQNGAEVMRVPPSPTGFVHIGTIYAGLVNERIAHQSGGVFILRIEDTDKKREVAGSSDMMVDAFTQFGLIYDEGPVVGGDYGPYFQSQRADIYLGYALDLLQKGRAYPCFATAEELATLSKDQQAKKLRPGYYGDFAIWRNKSEQDIHNALDQDLPFVLRLKSTGSHSKRLTFHDIFKGKMDVPENDLDVPLLKSDADRLPTYHLAHVVDDYLMGTTKVFRSDEWLPSTALHIEIAQALDLPAFTYGHFAPISIIDTNGGGKRKLSKRKDNEADVQFWLQAGYPIEGIKAYLLGLANSNFEDWYRAHPGAPLDDFQISIDKLAASRAPLLDMQKLEDYCKDFIAQLPQEEFERRIVEYAKTHNVDVFVDAVRADSAYSSAVFAIERSGDKPRKDMFRFDQAVDHYGYFFDSVFVEDVAKAGRAEYLADFDTETLHKAAQTFLDTYDCTDDQTAWFDKLKAAADATGFAIDSKAYKSNPENYRGNVADFARIIRVLVTGKNRTPDLWTIMQVMGDQRVRSRLSDLAS